MFVTMSCVKSNASNNCDLSFLLDPIERGPPFVEYRLRPPKMVISHNALFPSPTHSGDTRTARLARSTTASRGGFLQSPPSSMFRPQPPPPRPPPPRPSFPPTSPYARKNRRTTPWGIRPRRSRRRSIGTVRRRRVGTTERIRRPFSVSPNFWFVYNIYIALWSG